MGLVSLLQNTKMSLISRTRKEEITMPARRKGNTMKKTDMEICDSITLCIEFASFNVDNRFRLVKHDRKGTTSRKISLQNSQTRRARLKIIVR